MGECANRDGFQTLRLYKAHMDLLTADCINLIPSQNIHVVYIIQNGVLENTLFVVVIMNTSYKYCILWCMPRQLLDLSFMFLEAVAFLKFIPVLNDSCDLCGVDRMTLWMLVVVTQGQT